MWRMLHSFLESSTNACTALLYASALDCCWELHKRSSFLSPSPSCRQQWTGLVVFWHEAFLMVYRNRIVLALIAAKSLTPHYTTVRVAGSRVGAFAIRSVQSV
jgi:hypothetical protein